MNLTSPAALTAGYLTSESAMAMAMAIGDCERDHETNETAKICFTGSRISSECDKKKPSGLDCRGKGSLG